MGEQKYPRFIWGGLKGDNTNACQMPIKTPKRISAGAENNTLRLLVASSEFNGDCEGGNKRRPAES